MYMYACDEWRRTFANLQYVHKAGEYHWIACLSKLYSSVSHKTVSEFFHRKVHVI